MSNAVFNTGAFLRTSRSFPTDNAQALNVELNKTYLDIANNVNVRTIGSYATQQGVTGNYWFITGDQTRQQTLRQVFLFQSTGSIAHGINLVNSGGIVQAYGSFTDGTNWYGAIYASNVTITGQISFYVSSTDIVIQAGSASPTISSGYIVLEWLSNV